MKEFKAAGIEIPYNQHDIHLRDLDAVRALLNRLAEERASKSAAQNGSRPEKTRTSDVEEFVVEPPSPSDNRPSDEPPQDSPPPRGG
jgi:hypothetical protein